MNFLKRNLLFFMVFITGTAVLIIEVTAFRILAPYFGNTLYSTSSIIGVVLGALSLGYYIGGILADKYPKHSLFFFLIILAGAFSLLIQGLSKTLLVALGYVLGMIIGPPIASLFLFFIPSLILGMMSPFAIKLKSLEEKGIGRISGKVFFWSTFGSIVGSFAAGFFLIPFFGINIIIVSTGLLLLLVGILGLAFSGPGRFRRIFREPGPCLFVIFAILCGTGAFIRPKTDSVIFQKDGLYSQITVKDTETDNRKARILQLSFEGAVQGGIFLDNGESFLEYTKYRALYKLLNPRAEKILILGGGGYSLPRDFLSGSDDIRKIDIVEIEPELYPLAKKYFGFKDDPRISNHITDGRRFLVASKEEYDVIFSDVYSISSIPPHFTTREFFQSAKDKLQEDGIFMMNVVGILHGEANRLLFSEIKTFKSVFPASCFFAVDSPGTTDIQNFIFMGFREDNQNIDFSSKEILASEDEIIRELPEKLIDTGSLDLTSAYLLTDNFAPIEYLSAKVIARLR